MPKSGFMPISMLISMLLLEVAYHNFVENINEITSNQRINASMSILIFASLFLFVGQYFSTIAESHKNMALPGGTT